MNKKTENSELLMKINEQMNAFYQIYEKGTKNDLGSILDPIVSKKGRNKEHEAHFREHYAKFLQEVYEKAELSELIQMKEILDHVKNQKELTQSEVRLLEKFNLKNWESIIFAKGIRIGDLHDCYIGSTEKGLKDIEFTGSITNTVFEGKIRSCKFSGKSITDSTFADNRLVLLFENDMSNYFNHKINKVKEFQGNTFKPNYSKTSEDYRIDDQQEWFTAHHEFKYPKET